MALDERSLASRIADASDPVSIRAAIAKVRAELGQVAVIHWNAYSGQGLGDLLTVDPAGVKNVFDVAIVGLLSAVQEALPDLKAAGDGAVLVTNGAFGELNPAIDGLTIALNAVGVGIANAAKAKLVGLLAASLRFSPPLPHQKCARYPPSTARICPVM